MKKLDIIIRQATIDDHQGVTKYAIKLVHQHQDFNPLSFVEFESYEQQPFDLFEE